MSLRKIFIGKKHFILRMPFSTRLGGGFIILDKTKWSLHPNDTIKRSVLYSKLRRHFWITDGNVVFCADDAVCPNQTFELLLIARSSICNVYDILPEKFQISPTMK